MSFKIMRDKVKSRIDLNAVTSYSPDWNIVHNGSSSGKTDIMILTLGSAVRTLTYNSESDRDLDVADLDQQCGLLPTVDTSST